MIAALLIALALLVLPVRPGAAANDEVETAVARVTRVFGYYRGSNARPREIELGRALFFDRRLSSTGKMSCATCHIPSKNFGDGLRQAIARDGKPVTRNTPSLLTAAYHADLFWDGRASNIEEAALTAVQNPKEMAQPLPELIGKLSSIAEYRKAFADVYPDASISSTTIGSALGAYVLSEASPQNSPFDRFLADRTGLSESAKRGFLLFANKAECTNCHSSNHFSYNQRYQNIGLAPKGIEDPGRYNLDPVPELWGAFRVPSLRDVELTAPYMHDGQLATLRDVIDFYDRGGDKTRYQDSAIVPLHLTQQEKEDLLAFLLSLTSSRGREASAKR
jgi:cytochrome c peroxidase